METPQYIKSLLIRTNGKKPIGRKVWSIDLETIWLPFFTATNTMGETAVPSDTLGAPLRLAYNGDGSVKFSKSGRPVTKVAKDLSDNIRLVRENFTASLRTYANTVIAEDTDGYKAEVEKARQAGEPIINEDREKLNEALAKIRAQQLAEVMAQAKQAEAKAETKAEGKVKAKPKAEAELVGATS